MVALLAVFGRDFVADVFDDIVYKFPEGLREFREVIVETIRELIGDEAKKKKQPTNRERERRITTRKPEQPRTVQPHTPMSTGDINRIRLLRVKECKREIAGVRPDHYVFAYLAAGFLFLAVFAFGILYAGDVRNAVVGLSALLGATFGFIALFTVGKAHQNASRIRGTELRCEHCDGKLPAYVDWMCLDCGHGNRVEEVPIVLPLLGKVYRYYSFLNPEGCAKCEWVPTVLTCPYCDTYISLESTGRGRTVKGPGIELLSLDRLVGERERRARERLQEKRGEKMEDRVFERNIKGVEVETAKHKRDIAGHKLGGKKHKKAARRLDETPHEAEMKRMQGEEKLAEEGESQRHRKALGKLRRLEEQRKEEKQKATEAVARKEMTYEEGLQRLKEIDAYFDAQRAQQTRDF